MRGMLINETVRINRLKAEGYIVVKPDALEEFKSQAPDIYDKIYQQGKKEGRAQHKPHVEIANRAKARADEKRIQAEEKKPKTLEEKLKAAWDSKPELRKEFGGNYANCKSYFMNDEEFKATGKVLLSNPKRDTLFPKPSSTNSAKKIWDNDPQLRTEFGHNFQAYEMYVKS